MYRDSFPSCPSCRTELADTTSYRGCPSCRGVFVAEEVLTGMVWEMHRGEETEPLLWAPADGPVRMCPDCRKPMASQVLEGIPVERCAAHGIWLDNRELPQLLLNAAARPARSVGIKLDLAPIPRRGKHSEAGHASMRAADLSRWILDNVPAVTAQAQAMANGMVAKAIEPVTDRLRSMPLEQRPSYEAVIALDGRIVSGVDDAKPRSELTTYLRASRFFLRGWCVAYGVLVEHIRLLAVSPTHLRDYLDDIDTAQREAWSRISTGDERIGGAHHRLAQLIEQHVGQVRATLASTASSESDARRAFEHFVATLDEIEEATIGLVAACTA